MTEPNLPPSRLPFTPTERALAGIFAPRMGWWLWISIGLLFAVWYFAAHMLSVILYKAVLMTLSAFLADKIARAMESRNQRPHELLGEASRLRNGSLRSWSADMIPYPPTPEERERAWQLEQRADAVYGRRALIIAAGMIAAALGS